MGRGKKSGFFASDAVIGVCRRIRGLNVRASNAIESEPQSCIRSLVEVWSGDLQCRKSCQPREPHRVPSAANPSSLKRPKRMNRGGRYTKIAIGQTCNETRLRRQRKLRSDSSCDSENFLNNTNIVLRDEELCQR